MDLGFSRPRALHTSLERALLGASGHTAAYFIWQRPFSLNRSSNPTSDSSSENQFITGSIIEGCTDRHISHHHRMTSAQVWSQDQQSVAHVTGFLRTAGDCIQASSYLPSSLPFPSHSFLTQHGELWSEWRWKLTQEKQLGRNVIQSRWGGVRLTAAMKSHFELSMCWWSNEMKMTLQMAGDSNDCVCGVFLRCY